VTDLRGYHHEAGGGTAIWMLDTLMNVKAGGDETRGGFTLIEALAPSGFGTPLHIHHREEEGFYVLEGSMTVQCGDDRWVAEPESFVLLPRGVPHAYLVNEGPCRMLQVTSPAQFEKFAEEVGRPAESATYRTVSAGLREARSDWCSLGNRDRRSTAPELARAGPARDWQPCAWGYSLRSAPITARVAA